MNSVESSVYLFCISFHGKLFSFCPAACLQAGTRRIYEGTNTMDLDWFLRQSALHQPHRGQNGSSGSVGWGVQGVCPRAFIEKEVISCSAYGPHRKKTDSCHFDTLQVQEFGKHTNRIGNYRRRKNCFSNEPLPLHHVSVAVLGLWSTLFALWQFSPQMCECSPWSCQSSPNCLLLAVSPFVFYLGLFYAKSCTGDGSECLPQWKPSLGFLFITRNLLWRWMSSAQSGNVPLGSLPSGVWHWRHCWCQMCPSSCICCQCPVPSVELASTQLVTVSLLLAVLAIRGAGMWKQIIKCCPHLLRCFCYWKVLQTF